MNQELERARAAGAVRQSSDRHFGLVMAGFFFLVALVSFFRHRSIEKPLWINLSLIFAIFALFLPRALKPLNFAWTILGKVLHKIVSPLVMGLFYFGFFTPFGFFFRLVKGDPLRLEIDRASPTYWIKRDQNQPGRGMKNQF